MKESSQCFAKTVCVLSALLLLPTAAFAEKPPISGTSKPEFAPVDEAAVEFRTTIACDALTVAISKDGKLLYARGFGWRDAKHKLPAQSSTLMRIASVTKPFTESAVRKLVRDHKLTYDTKAFDFLKLPPPANAKEDPRLKEITVQMLLDHKGGWDRNKAFDPMFATQKIEKSLGLKHPARPADVVRYMLGQPLQFDPGSRSEYSNFGYCVLGRVIEKAAGKPYFNYVRDEILQPIGITDIKLAHDAVKNRDPEEAYYPAEVLVEVMDSHGGLIASAPASARSWITTGSTANHATPISAAPGLSSAACPAQPPWFTNAPMALTSPSSATTAAINHSTKITPLFSS